MQRVFVIRPFGVKGTGADAIDFDAVHAGLIDPALRRAGLAGSTTGEIVEPGNIREDMFALILEADIVIADISIHNANVFYELGIRHALRKRSTVLIRGTPTNDPPPFDILTDRYMPYEHARPASSLDALSKVIQAALTSDRITDSPVFKLVPALPDLDPGSVQVVPQDLDDEIGRAQAARSFGWLRLLAVEVEGLRFQWPALRRIGNAQWSLKDEAGARRTWRKILENDPDDLPANLAMASLWERQSRDEKRPEFLEDSERAINRVLSSGRATPAQQAEALALRGRNLKTGWRLTFETAELLAERRERATTRDLIDSYQAYRDAYQVDLNHHWSGIAALQMGIVALDLAKDEAWPSAFESDRAARAKAAELAEQVPDLRVGVSLAADAAIARARGGEPDAWAEVTRADLLFVKGEPRARTAKAYAASVKSLGAFARASIASQLRLLGSLGVRAADVEPIIAEARLDSPPPEPIDHVVMFAGHRIDEPGRAVPRFPDRMEPAAQAAIRQKLETLRTGRTVMLASAAPGGDILAHEACRALGIPGTICLPVPQDVYASSSFGMLDLWRSRFLALMNAPDVFELGDQPGLPRWLRYADANAWERGNRWVLEMALSSGARRITLLALWDRRPIGDDRGGTAHMVEIAHKAGTVDVVVIGTDTL